ncbi:MAG: hypothetical protein Q9M23_07955 [Mariprofundaceae bacterium]|nr:hypothetical protein [Mariprofundaceae bacterium]
METKNMEIAQKSIDEYLDAVNQVFGAEYRDKMVVECRGAHVLVKHPDVEEGELMPLGYMPILTRNVLSAATRQKTA